MLGRFLTAKGLAALGVVALGATGAAAATGSLPDAAQDGLANAGSHVGITLPASHDNHPTKDNHPGGPPEGVPPTTGAPTPSTGAPESNHGAEVSDVARNTDATGREKGEAVSTVARGDHGPSGDSEDAEAVGPETPTTGAPVTTPNPGGIATGSGASGDANSTGTEHAAPQASAGSGNAGDHPTGP
jgi:hypothetical protein